MAGKTEWHAGPSIVVIMESYRGHVPIWPTTITKIGRTKGHYELHGHKQSFFLDTGCVDCGKYLSSGRVWQSVEAYEADKELGALWKEMASRFPV